MGNAPIGLKVGDVYDRDGRKARVTGLVGDFGYNWEYVDDEPEQIELADLPFSDVENAPKKRGRKKTEE